ERLRGQGGGLISIFYHPCEWVHKEFWDGVNFRRGANPPREQWKPPPQRPPEETEAAFKRFAEYIDHIHSIPGVRFVTAGDLPGLYPDTIRAKGATEADLNEIAARLAGGGISSVDFQVINGSAYSVADQFELLAMFVGETIQGREPRLPLKLKGLFGPDAPPPSSPHADHLDWFAFRDATRDVFDFIKTSQRVPARVFIGADPVPPADFLVALASAYEFHHRNGKLPVQEGVTLGQNLQLLPAQHIARDTPDLFGGWIIHKEGFRAPKILEVARLQAWTLKPAESIVSAGSGQR
ncbi:MAG TPA: hypothetical protein VGH65_00210, partial [Verrucomicrobiaceae bacterium]